MEEHYLIILCQDKHSTPHNCYTDSIKTANEVYRLASKEGMMASICFGTSGHYKLVKRNFSF